MEGYKIYNLNEGTLKLYKSCFDSNGSSKNLENIRWQFLKNPTSSSFVNILFDESKDRTAGIYAISCVRFKINDIVKLGAQSLDTLTDIDYRGLGLFIKMANDVYEKAESNGVELIYGFPNGSSYPGFKKLLKWETLDPLPFLIKPLKSKYFTKKINCIRFLPNINLSFSKLKEDKSFKIEEKNFFPIEVNEIWKKFSENIKVSIIRDLTYLNWRYIEKPNEVYHILHCYSMENFYMGYVIYTVKEKHDGKIAYIMELIFDIHKPKVGRLLLRYAIQKIKEKNADCILIWCLEHAPNYQTFKKEFFFEMPEKLRPIKLHFGVRSLDKNLKPIINNRENWYISYSDSDTV